MATGLSCLLAGVFVVSGLACMSTRLPGMTLPCLACFSAAVAVLALRAAAVPVVQRIIRRHKVTLKCAGGLLCVLAFLNASVTAPTVTVELLTLDQWGFGGLPSGTKYYVRPQVTCVGAYGDSYRLGAVRLVTNVHYYSLLEMRRVGKRLVGPTLPPRGR